MKLATAALLFALSCQRAPAHVGTVAVKILAHDTSWDATVDGREAGREIHVPLGATVQLTLASRDYISLFALPAFGLRDFAAPGLPGTFTFRANRAGSFELRGDELCGKPHTDKTRGHVIVDDGLAWKAFE